MKFYEVLVPPEGAVEVVICGPAQEAEMDTGRLSRVLWLFDVSEMWNSSSHLSTSLQALPVVHPKLE